MSKYAMHFYTRCTDSAREEEFNSWYSHVHLPQLHQAIGVSSARRYVSVDSNCKARYLAVYEFETEDIQESLQSFFEIVRECFESVKHIDCIESVTIVNTPMVSCYKELLSEHVPRLSCGEYPKRIPDALKELEVQAARGNLEGHITGC